MGRGKERKNGAFRGSLSSPRPDGAADCSRGWSATRGRCVIDRPARLGWGAPVSAPDLPAWAGGTLYTAIIRRRCRCLDCGQVRIDKEYA